MKSPEFISIGHVTYDIYPGERLNETIKVKKGLEGVIEFLKKRKKT